jgi:hypothetical protein
MFIQAEDRQVIGANRHQLPEAGPDEWPHEWPYDHPV